MGNMMLPIDKNLNPIPVAPIGACSDITDGSFTSSGSVVRVCAISDVRLRVSLVDPGVLLPMGSIEYFSVPTGVDVLVVGTANVMVV